MSRLRFGFFLSITVVLGVGQPPRLIAGGVEICELVKLTPPDAAQPGHGVGFGFAVAINRDMSVVGALDDSELAESSGAVYVFRRQGSNWLFREKLKAPEPDGIINRHGSFGTSVALSDDILAVSAIYQTSFQGEGPPGAVYIYRRRTGPSDCCGEHDYGGCEDPTCQALICDGMSFCCDDSWNALCSDLADGACTVCTQPSAWRSEAKLLSPTPMATDNFGSSISIQSNRVAVGAPEDNAHPGHAYVFVFDGEQWALEASLIRSEEAILDTYGADVSLDGDRIAVAAPQTDQGGFESGSVYIFRRDGANWVQESKLVAHDAAPYDRFGLPSLSGNQIAVGVGGRDDLGTNSGAIYFYERQENSWIFQQKLFTSGTTPLYGFGYVSLDGDMLLAGATGDDSAGNQAGAAYRFERLENSWIETSKFFPSDAAANLYFGGLNQLHNGIAIIGTLQMSAAYIFGVGGDCNGNVVADGCDLADATSTDCDDNLVPDECDPDCNINQVPDACDVATGTSSDENYNQVPDECEPAIPTLSTTGGTIMIAALLTTARCIFGHGGGTA